MPDKILFDGKLGSNTPDVLVDQEELGVDYRYVATYANLIGLPKKYQRVPMTIRCLENGLEYDLTVVKTPPLSVGPSADLRARPTIASAGSISVNTVAGVNNLFLSGGEFSNGGDGSVSFVVPARSAAVSVAALITLIAGNGVVDTCRYRIDSRLVSPGTPPSGYTTVPAGAIVWVWGTGNNKIQVKDALLRLADNTESIVDYDLATDSYKLAGGGGGFTPSGNNTQLLDGTGAAISKTGLPVSTATQAAIDAAVTGLYDDRGSYDASGGAYPSSGGSGAAGAVLKGDLWTISVAGTLPTAQVVGVGDIVRALVDTPGNTQANWAIIENNIGYVAENTANKSTDGTLATNSNTKYPTEQAVKTYADGKVAALFGATATTKINRNLLLIEDVYVFTASMLTVRVPHIRHKPTVDKLTASGCSLIRFQLVSSNNTTLQGAFVDWDGAPGTMATAVTDLNSRITAATLPFDIQATATLVSTNGALENAYYKPDFS
jgi:hypothetical protein